MLTNNVYMQILNDAGNFGKVICPRQAGIKPERQFRSIRVYRAGDIEKFEVSFYNCHFRESNLPIFVFPKMEGEDYRVFSRPCRIP